MPKLAVACAEGRACCGRWLFIPASVERSVEQNAALILCSGRPTSRPFDRLGYVFNDPFSILFGKWRRFTTQQCEQ